MFIYSINAPIELSLSVGVFLLPFFKIFNKGLYKMTYLPRDNDNEIIPALRLNPIGAHAINATSSSARNAIAFDDETRVISLYATGPVYVQCGDNTVMASSSNHYFPAGVYYDLAIGGDKTLHTPYIAVIAAESDCTVYISEKI